MTKIIRDLVKILSCEAEWSESRQHDSFVEAQGASGGGLSEGGEVVFIRTADFLDDSVESEPFQYSGDL